MVIGFLSLIPSILGKGNSRSVALFVILSLCLGCSVFQGQGELKGEVFIVTKSGENIKLALVEIAAIPEAQINATIEKKKPSMDSTSAQLKADLERATAEYEPVRQQYEEAEHSYEKTYKEYFAAILDEGARQRWNYWSDQKMKVLKEELDKRSKKDEAERKVAAFPTAQFFFEGLPDGIAKARTNSNGEFSMTLPRKGRFALAARAHRETPDEKYYWLVWVSLNGEATKTVLLSNHNVMTAQSPDVVVRAKGMTL